VAQDGRNAKREALLACSDFLYQITVHIHYEEIEMSQNTRKLIGMVLLVSLVIIYAFLAMLIGASKLPGTSILVQTLYYVVAGLLWIIPAGILIKWMQRPDET